MSTTTTATTNTFKTNLNGVLNGCSPAALKQHITTCLQRWRQRHTSSGKTNKRHKQHQQHLATTPQEEKCYCHCQHNTNKWFGKNSSHHHHQQQQEYSFVQHTTVYCKTFNSKFQKLFHSQQRNNKSNHQHHHHSHQNTSANDSKGPRKYGRKVEIVAKLLSTTLIAKAKTSSTEDFAQQTDDSVYRSFEEQINVIQSSTTSSTTTGYYYAYDGSAMTITDLTFLELRQEYPDLDSEIRSILTARAQEGATISQIRGELRKFFY